MSTTCNQLDLQTLGSQPIMPKNLANHWGGGIYTRVRDRCLA